MIPRYVFDPAVMNESPWMASSHGDIVTPAKDEDACSTDDCGTATWGLLPTDGGHDKLKTASDIVARVVACDALVDAGQYSTIGVALLADGRYCAWESWTDMTGSGFHSDAYGGDQGFCMSATLGGALTYLSEQARDGLEWSLTDDEMTLAEVVHDAVLGDASWRKLVADAIDSGEWGSDERVVDQMARWIARKVERPVTTFAKIRRDPPVVRPHR